MSEIKDMLIDVVEKIFKDHVQKETVDLVEEGKWAENVWSILNDNGMLGVTISEDAGGADGDLEDLLNIYRLVGKYAVPIPFVEYTFANYLLELVKLPITERKVTYTVNTNEKLVFTGDQTVRGTLTNVPWARHADELVAIAKAEEGDYLVKVAIEDTFLEQNINLSCEPRDTIILENVKVLHKSVVALTSEQLQTIMHVETAAKVALMAGTIEKINDLTVQYTKEREQFGRPIHRFQLVQEHLALLAGETVIIRSAVDNMIAALVENRHQNEVILTRIRIDEATKTVSTSAHQVHGAIGVTHEHNLHQYTRRLWSYRDEGVTQSEWSEILANELLQSDESLWESLTIANKVYQTY
ncbi:acyl-CoA dehydrogenase family protein [Rummeliibacillus sp. NPDC094406]|uniref:acyl-CoA dehydrogenase family protein n=1 Tax=Rummeliibacillus sp. NPDC094406 TaxID=3364511 RepID=UPI00382A1020